MGTPAALVLEHFTTEQQSILDRGLSASLLQDSWLTSLRDSDFQQPRMETG